MARKVKAGIVLLVLSAVAGCGTRRAEPDIPVCEEPDGTLPAGFAAEALAGHFDLTIVASSGDSSGRELQGKLELVSLDSALSISGMADTAQASESPYRLVGSLDTPVGTVGAVNTGDLTSLDPASPGVAVLQRGEAEAPEVMLRFGALTNRVGVTLFDGGYTALTVTWADTLGFGGTWASGVRGPEAGGYFCAFRPVAGS